jgi:V-type H+-transporting ATPase subunit H
MIRRDVGNLTRCFRLVNILKYNNNPQMNYQVGFCFWLLTFETEIAEQINK